MVACLGIGFLIGLVTGVTFTPNHEAEAIRMQTQAKGWYQVAARAQARVDTEYVVLTSVITKAQHTTDTVLKVLREQHPECAAVVDTCEERLAVERAKLSSLEGLFRNEKAVADLWRQSADTAIAAVDQALKGKSFGWHLLHPELRPGAFAGYCTDFNGKWTPCVGGGLTLSWRF